MAISIVGYRGTGKTTVGALLASRLGWDAVDLDVAIESNAGSTIAEIFTRWGESHFRQLESEELQKQLARGSVIISTGGGAVLSDANRQALQAAGPVIWLTATVETIAQRLELDPTSADRRPALTNSDPLTEIRNLLARRLPLYASIASITVETDQRDPAAIVAEILPQLPHQKHTESSR